MTKIMKPFALAIAAVSMTSAAMAADLTNNYAEPPVYNEPARASGWGGAYVGADIGMNGKGVFRGDKGLALGVHGGYNVDMDSGVLGGELEVSHNGNADLPVPGGVLKNRFRVAAKAKAGVGVNNNQTLLYGTAGVTMSNFKGSNNVSGPDGWKPGYLVGAGIEHKLSNNLSARVEYNYVGTGDVRTTSGGTSSKSDVRDQTVKVGMNYKF